jgi:hypothetical protein
MDIETSSNVKEKRYASSMLQPCLTVYRFSTIKITCTTIYLYQTPGHLQKRRKIEMQSPSYEHYISKWELTFMKTYIEISCTIKDMKVVEVLGFQIRREEKGKYFEL